MNVSICFYYYVSIRSVANRLNEVDQQSQSQSGEDVEMASIAEDELLNEKFSVQGTSTGKISGRKKVVSNLFLRMQSKKLLDCKNNHFFYFQIHSY